MRSCQAKSVDGLDLSRDRATSLSLGLIGGSVASAVATVTVAFLSNALFAASLDADEARWTEALVYLLISAAGALAIRRARRVHQIGLLEVLLSSIDEASGTPRSLAMTRAVLMRNGAIPAIYDLAASVILVLAAFALHPVLSACFAGMAVSNVALLLLTSRRSKRRKSPSHRIPISIGTWTLGVGLVASSVLILNGAIGSSSLPGVIILGLAIARPVDTLIREATVLHQEAVCRNLTANEAPPEVTSPPVAPLTVDDEVTPSAECEQKASTKAEDLAEVVVPPRSLDAITSRIPSMAKPVAIPRPIRIEPVLVGQMMRARR